MSDPDATAEPAEPAETAETAEQARERARRADRATKGAMAGVLGLEALVVLLAPRAIAFSTGGLGVTKTVLLIALAVLMVLVAGTLRRPWGVAAGSVLQVLFILTGIWLIALLVIGAIFAVVWGRLLLLRRDLVGTPGGWRMLTS